MTLFSLTDVGLPTGEGRVRDAGDATNMETVYDAGETSKEPDDHLSDEGVYTGVQTGGIKIRMSVYIVLSTGSTHVAWVGAASLPFESGPSSSDSSLSELKGSAMILVMMMVSRKRICTSYGMMKVIGSSFLSLWLRDQVTSRVEYAYVQPYDCTKIKDRLKVARDRQKSYADKRRKPLEFGVGYVAYRLDLPEELNGVHDMFHVLNLKKCFADPTLQVPLDEIRVETKLNFVEEPVKVLEREFKKLKRSRIAIVKVRWNSKCGPEFTWKREDQMKLKYPHLFSDISS
nr:putative reverse transcriptase domain-containing protein [Tanacetum cinerariifolium]